MGRYNDKKSQSNAGDYLKKLQENTSISLRSDIKNLSSRFRHTVGNPSYWIRLRPFFSISLAVAACGLISSATVATAIISRRHKKHLAKITLVEPIIRYALGLAMSSALPLILRRTQFDRVR